MNRDSVFNFIVTGSVVLPLVLYFGTGSLDIAAMAMTVVMLTEMVLLIVRGDDPIGDKMRADAKEHEEAPPE